MENETPIPPYNHIYPLQLWLLTLLLGQIPLLCFFARDMEVNPLDAAIIPVIFMVSVVGSVPLLIVITLLSRAMQFFELELDLIKLSQVIVTLIGIFLTFYSLEKDGLIPFTMCYSLGAILSYLLIFFNEREKKYDEMVERLLATTAIESANENPREG